jgi:hypothetical protein
MCTKPLYPTKAVFGTFLTRPVDYPERVRMYTLQRNMAHSRDMDNPSTTLD